MEQRSVAFELKDKKFFEENVFENVVCNVMVT